MKLVICEKPSVAKAVASALGVTSRADGCFEGNGLIVSWCVGHLVSPMDAAGYDLGYKICPIPLCGELRHLLVDEPLLLLRHPELHLDVPLSVYHSASPPFLIRVWDYPSKQFSCLGAGVPLNRKSASGYSLAVLAIVTLPSYSPSTNTTI